MKFSLLLTMLVCFYCCAKAQTSLRVTGDSVILKGIELKIHNGTKHQPGFLYHTGNGQTVFRNLGSALQFSVGTAGFPAAGENTYLNSGFIQKYIKVWRNGLLQAENASPGITVNAATGSITFSPSLAQSERIYIEVLHKTDFIR